MRISRDRENRVDPASGLPYGGSGLTGTGGFAYTTALVCEGAACGDRHLRLRKSKSRRKRRAMAVPKSKITRSKRNMRRAHDALKSDAYVEDKTTGELHRPHHIDLKSGMYRGRQVIEPKD